MTGFEVRLPELGEGVSEGELVKWLVKVGDKISPDQAIAEIMTDKATVEVPSKIGGTVKSLHFKPGETVQVEKVLVTLEGGASGASASPAPHSAPPKVSAVAASAPVSTISVNTTSVLPPAGSRVLASPAARKAARGKGIDINQVNGSGPAGRVLMTDLDGSSSAVVGSKSSVPSAIYTSQSDVKEPLIGIRKKIALNMQKSKHIIPHFTLMDEARVDSLVELREALKASSAGVKITYLPFLMKALVASCKEFPMLNASIDDEAAEIIYKKSFHIGFAADTPQGLVVPVVKNADQKTLQQIAAEIQDLSTRARENKLKVEDMKGATITITNIGSISGMSAAPIINHPEVAIIGVYRIFEKLLMEDGEIQSGKFMNLTVTADHRLVDGARAAQFLRHFIDRVENPGLLMMGMV